MSRTRYRANRLFTWRYRFCRLINCRSSERPTPISSIGRSTRCPRVSPNTGIIIMRFSSTRVNARSMNRAPKLSNCLNHPTFSRMPRRTLFTLLPFVSLPPKVIKVFSVKQSAFEVLPVSRRRYTHWTRTFSIHNSFAAVFILLFFSLYSRLASDDKSVEYRFVGDTNMSPDYRSRRWSRLFRCTTQTIVQQFHPIRE